MGGERRREFKEYCNIIRGWISRCEVDPQKAEWTSRTRRMWDCTIGEGLNLKAIVTSGTEKIDFEIAITFSIVSQDSNRVVCSRNKQGKKTFAVELNPRRVSVYWLADSSSNYNLEQFAELVLAIHRMIAARVNEIQFFAQFDDSLLDQASLILPGHSSKNSK